VTSDVSGLRDEAQRRDDLVAAIADIQNRLDAVYAAQLGREHVTRVVEESAALAARARFLNYVPVLVEKAARDELRADARASR
jgi:hypothetical protein